MTRITTRSFALASLFLSLAVAASCSGRHDPATGAPAAPPPRPVPQGLATGDLGPSDLRLLGDLLAIQPSPCKKGQSLYDAFVDSACPRARFAARYLVKLVGERLTEDEIDKRYAARELLPPAKVDVSDSPMEGEPAGTIWIAEFADFQCPFCARVQNDLTKVLTEEPGNVRVYFKFFPLPQHPYGRAAARAAEAAARQGKFWPYGRLLFTNQEKLDPALIDSLAAQAGLDMARFRADEASPEVDARVQRDADEGRQLGVEATPTLFINGRMIEGYADAEEIEDWIAELGPQ